jgi:hypothetical protein
MFLDRFRSIAAAEPPRGQGDGRTGQPIIAEPPSRMPAVQREPRVKSGARGPGSSAASPLHRANIAQNAHDWMRCVSRRQGALALPPSASQRPSHASTSACHCRLLAGATTQWFSSGNDT